MLNSGSNNPMFGRKHSDETKAKIAASRKKYIREKAASWKGGRRVNHNGYIEIFMPDHHRSRGNGYVFEHIVIAEGKIGREIIKGENVHHIDHNRKNNSPENLEVMDAAEHIRQHHTRKKQGIYKDCVICGTQFYRKLCHSEKAKCCSLQCVGKYTHMIKKGMFKNAE